MTEESLKIVIDVLKTGKSYSRPDWYEVLGFLVCHKAAGMFYKKAARNELNLPKKAEAFLLEIFEKQKRKVEFLRGQIRLVSERLLSDNVDHAFLKGSVLSNIPLGKEKLYADGERVSADIDLSVNPNGISAVAEALKSMGFVQGQYDSESGKIVKFSRSEILARRMNRGEVAPFVKLSGNAEFPFAEIDVNFSLGNTPSDGKELLENMLETSKVYRGDATIRAFTPEMFFIHLVLHQYKESRSLFMVKRNKDSDLYKLADIYYMSKNRAADFERIKSIAEEFDISDRVGAVLAQVGEIFCDAEISAAANEFDFSVPHITDYENKKTYEWTAGYKDRIRCFDTKKFLTEI